MTARGSGIDADLVTEFGDSFDWSAAGKMVGATPKQIAYARARVNGKNQGEAARIAGYAGKDMKALSAESVRVERSPAVMALRALWRKFDPNEVELPEQRDVLKLLAQIGKSGGSAAVQALKAYDDLKNSYDAARDRAMNTPESLLARIDKTAPDIAAYIRYRKANNFENPEGALPRLLAEAIGAGRLDGLLNRLILAADSQPAPSTNGAT